MYGDNQHNRINNVGYVCWKIIAADAVLCMRHDHSTHNNNDNAYNSRPRHLTNDDDGTTQILRLFIHINQIYMRPSTQTAGSCWKFIPFRVEYETLIRSERIADAFFCLSLSFPCCRDWTNVTTLIIAFTKHPLMCRAVHACVWTFLLDSKVKLIWVNICRYVIADSCLCPSAFVPHAAGYLSMRNFSSK